jgi:pimeloyl-ACP methyl ester carboxylesterase
MPMSTAMETGFVDVNGLQIHWEARGSGGTPLVVLHGGFWVMSMMADLMESFAVDRRVIGLELQGHGQTADIDRPLSYHDLGDDIAGAIEALGLGPVDLLGYSLGGCSSMRAAIQHPHLIRRLAIVSSPFRRDAWFPEVAAAMSQMSSAGSEFFQHTPMYAAYAEVAPDVSAFPALMDKMGDLLRTEYDWSADVAALPMPTLYVCGDADSFPPSHAVEFFTLRGGGGQDGGYDGSSPTPHRLAILPGRTHYDIYGTPEMIAVTRRFLDAL